MQNHYETFLVQIQQGCKNTNYSSIKELFPLRLRLTTKERDSLSEQDLHLNTPEMLLKDSLQVNTK